MSKLSFPEPSQLELQSDDGTLRIERCGARTLWAELGGRIGLAHVRALSEFAEGCIAVAPVNMSLFLSLSQVASFDASAQEHLASWARDKALYFDHLHFVLEDPALIRLIRAMFMALPVRAYLHKDRASFDAARARLG
jgi:hypothetical protein